MPDKKTVENECQLRRKCFREVVWCVERVEGVIGVLAVFCVMLVGNDGILSSWFTWRVSKEGNRSDEEELRVVLSCCLLDLSSLYKRSMIHRVSG